MHRYQSRNPIGNPHFAAVLGHKLAYRNHLDRWSSDPGTAWRSWFPQSAIFAGVSSPRPPV